MVGRLVNPQGVDRIHQVVLIGSLLPLCWLGMMAVHEFGHVMGAWATGGTVSRVVLHPFAISRTDISPNPQPLIVVWAGPLVGVLLPLACWAIALWARIPGAYLLKFWAGFCSIANGAYLGVGSFDAIGDAGEMLKLGTPIWLLWLFGLILTPCGLALWHRLGPSFGFGDAGGRVDRWAAYGTSSALVVVLLVMSLLGGGV